MITSIKQTWQHLQCHPGKGTEGERGMFRFKPLGLENSLNSTDPQKWSRIVWRKEVVQKAKKVGEKGLHSRAILCGKNNISHGSDIQSRTVSFSISILQSTPGLHGCQLRDQLHPRELQSSVSMVYVKREFQGRLTHQNQGWKKGKCNHNIASLW